MASNYSLNHKKFLEEREWRYMEADLIPRLKSEVEMQRRDSMILLMLLRTGARSCEIRNVRTHDFNPERGTIFLHGAKGSKDREIVLPPYLAEAVKSYVGGLAHGALIYPFTYTTITNAWYLYRPNPERSLHSLRHTFGLNVYKKTKDVRLVQYALGHKNITNTLIYVDYAYSQSELKKLIF